VSRELERPPLDELAERWQAAWTGEAGFDASCAVEVTYEDPVTTDPLDGLAALEAYAGRLRRAFPDLRIESTAPRVQTGAHAVFPWRIVGTHKGELGPLPATDHFVTLHGLHYVELNGDKISRARGFFDLYEAVVQLGLAATTRLRNPPLTVDGHRRHLTVIVPSCPG
jgi:steroid delta-isomerase-like uncharacterized protein